LQSSTRLRKKFQPDWKKKFGLSIG